MACAEHQLVVISVFFYGCTQLLLTHAQPHTHIRTCIRAGIHMALITLMMSRLQDFSRYDINLLAVLRFWCYVG